jgi:hypothetical protein
MKINVLISRNKFIAVFFVIIFFLFYRDTSCYAQSSLDKRVAGLNSQSVELVYKDTLILPSDAEFNLPVKMKPAGEISAITIGFYFPQEYLEITGLELADSTTGYYYNVSDSLFLLSWSDIHPISISENDTILVLKMKSLDLSGLTETIKLELYEFTEFADQSANIIEGVELEIPEIEYFRPDTIDTITGYYVDIFPNPFDDYATIYFGLKEESRVKIAIYNPDGMIIKDFGEETYQEGDHQVRIYGSDLVKGVFLVKFEIRNSEKSSKEFFKMISIK